MDLSQQVVLITGASSGIGAALAHTLARQFPGIRLSLAARRLEKLEAIADACRQLGADVLVVPTDLMEIEQVEGLAHKTLEHFGQVNALVNNAGYGQMGPVELIPTHAVQRQFAVNVIAPIALTRILIPTFRAQGGGRIVNVSSLGGRLAFPFGGLYSASKFALEGLSDALRMELEPFNIQVSVIEPGPVQTGFFEVANSGVEEAIANPLETPYQAAFAKLEALEVRMKRQIWSSERVATVIVRALSDRHPRPRYVAATGGDILLFVMTKLLPTWMVDRFWQRFYGIDLVAQDWQFRSKHQA
jgi:short-subunit dehydrogenase